jgi:hypothetical protein
VTWLRRMFYLPSKLEAGEGINPTVAIVEGPDDVLQENAVVREAGDGDVEEEVRAQVIQDEA